MTDEELIAQMDHWVEQEVFGLTASDILPIRDRFEALVKEMASGSFYKESDVDALQDRIKRLEAAVLAAAKIGQIIGFLGEDEGRIEAFREACGPELWDKARTALKGGDHV